MKHFVNTPANHLFALAVKQLQSDKVLLSELRPLLKSTLPDLVIYLFLKEDFTLFIHRSLFTGVGEHYKAVCGAGAKC